VQSLHRFEIGCEAHVRLDKAFQHFRHFDAASSALQGNDLSLFADVSFDPALKFFRGFALQQRSLPFQTPKEVAAVAEVVLKQMGDAYPHLAEMIVKHALKPGYDYAKEFATGLDLILDGVERMQKKPS